MPQDLNDAIRRVVPDGEINRWICRNLAACTELGDTELAQLKEQMKVLEPDYFAKKKRIEDLEEKKRMEITATMEKEKSIEFAHMRLLEALKTNYNRIDYMPENVYKFYSDQCGEPVDKLKEWLKQEIANKGIKG